MDNIFNECNSDDNIQVIDLSTLRKYYYVEDEVRTADMTSLGTFLLFEQAVGMHSTQSSDYCDDDMCLQRLSLAYEGLSRIPQILLEEVAPYVKILDLSYNSFQNLQFLTEFKELTSLICDHNTFTSSMKLPFLPKLDLLWMNHCKISDLYTYSRMLQFSCPNLKYLSLMGNPVSPFYHSNGNIYEYFHYRWFLISLFPNLIHLDDTPITEEDRMLAEKAYQRPLLDRLMPRTNPNLPQFLRVISEKMSEFVSQPPATIFSTGSQRNVVI